MSVDRGERGPAAAEVAARRSGLLPPAVEGQFVEPEEFSEHIIGPLVKGHTTVLGMPTIMFTTMQSRAREDGLDRVLTEEFAAKLNPRGVHNASNAHRIIEGATGRSFVRALMRLSLRDDPTYPWCEWFDFTEANLGSVIEASHRAPSTGTGMVRPRLSPRIPRWQGAVSFAPVVERARELAVAAPFEGSGDSAVNPRMLMAVTEATMLNTAHVLRVDPQQVAVLPAWEKPEEIFDYALDATLPFEPIYLDFEGVGGVAPLVATGWNGSGSPTTLTLSGALLFRNEDADLVVVPYGWPPSDYLDHSKIQDTKLGWSRHQSPGWFVFGRPLHEDTVFTRTPDSEKPMIAGKALMLSGLNHISGEAVCIAGDVAYSVDDADLPGYTILPFHTEQFRSISSDSDEVAGVMIAWADLVGTLAAKALAALSITEAAEVVIADAPMEKRDRKRAEKRGWPLAQQVFIRPIRKYSATNPPTGDDARYSHRFWRRATVAHYPVGTRIADARPDLVTLCNRAPEQSCGVCRKVKHPPCIVGPEDKPLVLKTLVGAKRA